MNTPEKQSGNKYEVDSLESIWGEPSEIITELIHRNVSRGDRAIDAPCGDGRYADILCKAVGENGLVINADIDGIELQRMHKRIDKKYKSRLETVQADLTHPLPFQDESLNVFLCLGFAHLPDQKLIRNNFFPEAMRVIKPTGNFIGNFLVDVTRTNLTTGTIIPTKEFAKQSYSENEGLEFLKRCFETHTLNTAIYKGLSFDYPNTDPPYNLSGTSIVYEVEKNGVSITPTAHRRI